MEVFHLQVKILVMWGLHLTSTPISPECDKGALGQCSSNIDSVTIVLTMSCSLDTEFFYGFSPHPDGRDKIISEDVLIPSRTSDVQEFLGWIYFTQ